MNKLNINPYVLPGIEDAVFIKRIKADKREEQFNNVLENVCNYYDEDVEKLMSNHKSRKREYVVIRQICMAIFIKKLSYSQADAGAFFNKNHATALHAVKTIRNIRETDRNFRIKTDVFFKNINLN